MPADSLTALYNFEGQIEPGIVTVLEQNLTVGGASVKQTREIANLTTPRIDVALRMGKQTGQLLPYKGNLMPVTYDASLVCTVCTERETNTNAADLLRAQLRVFMLVNLTRDPAAIRLTSQVLPFHVLTSLQESGTENIVDPPNNLDYSRVSFALKVGIRQDAFPP